MKHYKPFYEWLESLPEPETPWEKFVCWLSNTIDDFSIRKAERRLRKRREKNGQDDH